MGRSLRKTTKMLNLSKWNLDRGKKVCHMTVHNYLKTTDWCLSAFKSTVRLRLSEKNTKDRLSFGVAVEESGYLTSGPRGDKLRSNKFFTDDSMIEMGASFNPQNVRFRTENRSDVPPKRQSKFGTKVIMTGGFSAGGVSKLHFIEEKAKIKAKYYDDKILPVYFEAMDSSIISSKKNITFQQDGAKAHTADSTIKILNVRFKTVWGRVCGPEIVADLNPIENLCSVLKDSVDEDRLPKTLVELRVRFEEKWNYVAVELLQKLASSFKTRVKETMVNEGGHTRY